MKKLFCVLVSYIYLVLSVNSQVANPVTWKFESKLLSANTVELRFTANIDASYHMYGAYFAEGGPIPTSFHFEENTRYTLAGKIIEEIPAIKKHDASFDMDITLHSKKAIFIQKIHLNGSGSILIKGYVEYMACTDKNCLPPVQQEFEFSIEPAKTSTSEKINNAPKTTDTAKVKLQTLKVFNSDSAIIEKSKTKTTQSGSTSSIWGFLILAFLAGLAAAATPCVYPMIPMTVSFFLRGSENRFRAITKGLLFGASIIIIYLIVGTIGGSFIQLVANHWIANLCFFALFVVFALSFLGAFEIILPSSLANNVDKQADKGGYVGVFFMALALVILSFSCTVPFISSIIVEGATRNLTQTVLGILAYSTAFALPYTIFALSPTLLKSMPKSGGWLNAVKILLGLFMIAFSFKFLGSVDQAFHINLLSRELVLSIWSAILIMAGMYLLGKIKFSHDSDLEHVTVPRFIMALLSFAFAIYFVMVMITNANLKTLSSFLPPMTERIASIQTSGSDSQLCETPKYADLFHLPYGLKGYYDFKQGMDCAKKQNKPVLIDFKGHACGNCKVMEAEVWSDAEVQKILREQYIVIALYTDDRTDLPVNEQFVSVYDGKKIKTIGQANLDLQISRFKSNALPLYVILNPEGETIGNSIGLETNVQKYIEFLNQRLENSTTKK
jgi:thiol:disulfide interchange protein